MGSKAHVAETCMFFVDDSNVWIEAQKFAAQGYGHVPKLAGRDRDPRLRIDVGKLIDTLRGGDRIQGPSFLYGSRPPRNDSVWEAFGRFQFKTNIYNRANGKEKEVDGSMTTRLSAEATELRIKARYGLGDERARTTFIVVTGDRDMLPAVKEVLACGIKVELWAWVSGISQVYLELASHDGLMSVRFMDDIFGDIFFTAFQSTRQCTRIDGGQTIVLCGLPNSGPIAVDDGNGGNSANHENGCQEQGKLIRAVGEHLLQLGRLFYITPSRTGLEFYVEFPEANDMDAMIRAVRDLGAPEPFNSVTVESWIEYWSWLNRDSPAAVKSTAIHSNMFMPVMNSDENRHTDSSEAEKGNAPTKRPNNMNPWKSVAETQDQQVSRLGAQDHDGDENDNNGEDDQPWQTMSRRGAGQMHKRESRKKERCPCGLRCPQAGECGYYHTEEERNLYRDYPNQNFKLWKTRKCANAHCRRGKRCAFAHTEAEVYCLKCRVEGHAVDDCQYVRRDSRPSQAGSLR